MAQYCQRRWWKLITCLSWPACPLLTTDMLSSTSEMVLDAGALGEGILKGTSAQAFPRVLHLYLPDEPAELTEG